MNKPENASQFVVKVRVVVEMDVEVQIMSAQSFDAASTAAQDILKGAIAATAEGLRASSPNVRMVDEAKVTPTAIMAGWAWNQ